MIADKRMLPLAKIAAKADKTRRALQHVYVHDNRAVATNGSIIAMTEFDEFTEGDYPVVAGMPNNYTKDGMLVGHEQIVQAFKAAPKKTTLPVLQNVAVQWDPETKQSKLVVTDMKSSASFSTSQGDGPYPAYPDIWPRPRDPRKRFTFGVSLPNLEHIVNLLKETKGALPAVYFRGPIGNVHAGVTFFTAPAGSDYSRVTFKGMVMPLRIDENRDSFDHLDYIDLKDKPDPNDIVLDENHWDCECDVRYIHPNEMLWCPYCRVRKQDQPQSRRNEVEMLQKDYDSSVDLVLPGTDTLPEWMLTDVYEEGVTESKGEAA